jgi:purine-binding chemotaxis protein CheW
MDLKEIINRSDQLDVEVPSVEEENLLTEGNVIQLVSFILEDVEYGIDILSVHEIMRIPEITRLPNTPSFIVGVINLRGNIIPVVDVRLRFGMSHADVTELTRIIVIETNDKLVGLMVDNVYQVVRLPQNSIDPPSEMIEGVSEDYIMGIGRLKNRLIVILNLKKILFLEEEQD